MNLNPFSVFPSHTFQNLLGTVDYYLLNKMKKCAYEYHTNYRDSPIIPQQFLTSCPPSLSLLVHDFRKTIGVIDGQVEVLGLSSSCDAMNLLSDDEYQKFINSTINCTIIVRHTNVDDIFDWDELLEVDAEEKETSKVTSPSLDSTMSSSHAMRSIRSIRTAAKSILNRATPHGFANRLIHPPEILNLMRLYSPQYIRKQLDVLSKTLSNAFTNAFTM